MNEVAILLSTYNGKLYLEEQLDSIINQTFKNWNLYIRDDGSSDGTQEIIKKYVKIDSRIIYLEKESKENLGVKKSFFSLLESVDSHYYFFCDQDDFWMENKVQDTLDFLKEHEENGIPTCVHTDLRIVDKELNEIYSSMIESQQLEVNDSLTNLLVQNSVTGCTLALNNELKKKLPKNVNIDKIIMHDWWIALVGSVFGKVVLLEKQTILYRQHGNNEVGAQSLFSKLFKGYGLKELIESVVKTLIQGKELDRTLSIETPENKKEELNRYLSLVESSETSSQKWLTYFKKKGKTRNFVFYLVVLFKKSAIRRLYFQIIND